MICPFCGKPYSEEEAAKECRSCSVFGGCKKTKCPHCGYESPQETALVKWMRKRMAKQK